MYSFRKRKLSRVGQEFYSSENSNGGESPLQVFSYLESKEANPPSFKMLMELYKNVRLSPVNSENDLKRLVVRDAKLTPTFFLGLDLKIQRMRNAKIQWIFEQKLLISEPNLREIRYLAASIFDRTICSLYQKSSGIGQLWSETHMDSIASSAFFIAAKHEGEVFFPQLTNTLPEPRNSEGEGNPWTQKGFWGVSTPEKTSSSLFPSCASSQSTMEGEVSHEELFFGGTSKIKKEKEAARKELEILQGVGFQIWAPTMINIFYSLSECLNFKQLLGFSLFENFEADALEQMDSAILNYRMVSLDSYTSVVLAIIHFVLSKMLLSQVLRSQVLDKIEEKSKELELDFDFSLLEGFFNRAKSPKKNQQKANDNEERKANQEKEETRKTQIAFSKKMENTTTKNNENSRKLRIFYF